MDTGATSEVLRDVEVLKAMYASGKRMIEEMLGKVKDVVDSIEASTTLLESQRPEKKDSFPLLKAKVEAIGHFVIAVGILDQAMYKIVNNELDGFKVEDAFADVLKELKDEENRLSKEQVRELQDELLKEQ